MTSFHMTPEEFRRRGKAMVDWIADYYDRVESFPVLSQAKPGELRAALPAHAPERGESFDAMMADVERLILPGITHWQSPNFFAYFPSNNSFPSILGEMLSAGLGVQGMLWATSPACTELETHVLDWLVDMLALPAEFASGGPGGGVIQDTASSASLCALIAARDIFQEREVGGRDERDALEPVEHRGEVHAEPRPRQPRLHPGSGLLVSGHRRGTLRLTCMRYTRLRTAPDDPWP